MFTIPATINGTPQAVTGFTSPTWATSQSSTTVPNGKTYVVSGKGGTQPAAVDVHSASRPWTIMCTKPSTVKQLPPLNAAGVLPSIPVNSYTLSSRKGVTVLAGQPSAYNQVDTNIKVAAGSDVADPENLAAQILAHAMMLIQMAQDIVNTAKTGEI